jgi:hypothetical protein
MHVTKLIVTFLQLYTCKLQLDRLATLHSLLVFIVYEGGCVHCYNHVVCVLMMVKIRSDGNE